MKIISIVGARPNFMKIAPIMEEIKKNPSIEHVLVHTGQHYDEKMSKLFFEDLKIPKPDIYLQVGSASHAVQTANIMLRFESVLIEEKPDLVIVVGDVNSTIACALVSVKMGVPVAHVEAGLRSFDRNMPEEINRILTDAISEYHFTTEKKANKNLIQEGIPEEKIFFVGNVMIDTLLKHREIAKKSNILSKLNLFENNNKNDDWMKGQQTRKEATVIPYAVLTLHRPSNVDHEPSFKKILEAIEELSQRIQIIFPAHPRTRKQIEKFRYENYFVEIKSHKQQASLPLSRTTNIYLIHALGYIDFLNLMSNSKMVLTDSGGIQEETTALKVPCLTLRENTERPVTVEEGSNVIVGSDKDKIILESMNIIEGKCNSSKIPELWDGEAAKRIVNIIKERFRKKIL